MQAHENNAGYNMVTRCSHRRSPPRRNLFLAGKCVGAADVIEQPYVQFYGPKCEIAGLFVTDLDLCATCPNSANLLKQHKMLREIP